MKQEIKINQAASYYKEGNGNKLLYVLHGYGQLAKYFIRKFLPATEQGYTVVAPEGQHYFYLKGTSGRVGASWMTKENREQDIANYLTYLSTIHTGLTTKNEWDEIVVIGFSQGVATAFRWLMESDIKPNKFLICSGLVPPDIDLNIHKAIFESIKMTYFSGINDPYGSEDAVQEFYNAIASSKLDMELVTFDGAHEVNIEKVIAQL